MEYWLNYQEWLTMKQFRKEMVAYEDYINDSFNKSIKLVIDSYGKSEITCEGGLINQINNDSYREDSQEGSSQES